MTGDITNKNIGTCTCSFQTNDNVMSESATKIPTKKKKQKIQKIHNIKHILTMYEFGAFRDNGVILHILFCLFNYEDQHVVFFDQV